MATNSTERRKRSIWDWATVIWLPIAIAGIAAAFQWSASCISQRSDDRRAQAEQKLEAVRANETALQVYMDRMSDLLLVENPEESDQDAVVWDVGRARTLEALARLDQDEDGKRLIMQFLKETGLIEHRSPEPLILLEGANLRGADLSDLDLSNTGLRGADLSLADLVNADLRGADLSDAILNDANLSLATLTNASLRDADLSLADLTLAKIGCVDWTDAKGVTDEQLIEAVVSECAPTSVIGTPTPEPSPTTTPTVQTPTPGPGPTMTPIVQTPTPTPDECYNEFFAGFFPDREERVVDVESGTKEIDFFETPQSIRGLFGLRLTEGGRMIGGIQAIWNPDSENFRIIDIVDMRCVQIEEYSNVTRGGKDTLQNWDTLEIKFGRSLYELRLGFDGEAIGVNVFGKIS